ncbi:MAG: haloacid dehalogenase-like hydrolase [Planctomycetota bacterium]|nr:haloacid dehalogenase-like hydrolase [Planctomycetota bacterium]
MLIGVDFDNTLVCYDRLFHQLALELALIPATLPADKESVRDYLRAAGHEDQWTELQGLAYGLRIGEAVQFPGAGEFFRGCHEQGIPVCVVSHKTRLPVRGPQVDLQQAARGWLAGQGFHDPEGIGLPIEQVFFAETKVGKLRRIAAQRCTHFIDDLPEFLREPDFPQGVERLLFDPQARHAGKVPFLCLSSWDLLHERLLFR